jgi:hypothetical protein
MNEPDEKLNELRKVIATECDRRMMEDGQIVYHEVAKWLLCHQRKAVIDGLSDLVDDVMEQREVERLSFVADKLHVPLRYLLKGVIRRG